MNVPNAAAFPLVLHDPYFSIWANGDHLYDKDPIHWSGARQKIRGYLSVDEATYCFLGDKEFCQVIPQQSVDVTATGTKYRFENEALAFRCQFTSPLLPSDLLLASRPCTYLDFEIQRKTAKDVTIHLLFSADLVRHTKDQVIGFSGEKSCGQTRFQYGSMGRTIQQPLNQSGDNLVTIDWGYLYAACQQPDATIRFDAANEQLCVSIPVAREQTHADMILAYDDLLSIHYFGQWQKAYWARIYPTILDAIGAAFSDKTQVFQRCRALDQEVYETALAVGGEDYAYLCSMAFRHTMAAHKLILDDEGNVIFLSKENDSNGCIGTADVSYPSVPLFLLHNPELVKGMLRPIFRFADCEVWDFDYAPHDVGRYPYAWGQVYGLNTQLKNQVYLGNQHCVYPPFYLYPSNSGIYDQRFQMPVEECGNMLIMTAAVCRHDGTGDFARPYWHLLDKWKDYLLTYGSDPGDQLCTDDFAGHLAHNVNLSAKAIMGIEAYAQIAKLLGDQDRFAQYHRIAADMASDWERRAYAGDHYMLCFGTEESWSLKYNLVWDKLWGSKLFSDSVYTTELSYYQSKNQEFGVPLDNRATYTKSDWIAWCAAMSDKPEQRKELIAPIAHYLKTTSTRVPFSDWYDAVTGRYVHFIARSVQGGLYMPIYAQICP